MHINRTFSLKLSTVEDLNEKVRPKLRSKFVDRAINDRLSPEKGVEIDWSRISSERILSLLRHRDDISSFLKRAIEMELKVGQ